jgi:hypothetical protein
MNITTVGIDLAKNVFQVHAVDARGKVVLRKQLRRAQVSAFISNMPPCLIGMEACASAHHWGRAFERCAEREIRSVLSESPQGSTISGAFAQDEPARVAGAGLVVQRIFRTFCFESVASDLVLRLLPPALRG